MNRVGGYVGFNAHDRGYAVIYDWEFLCTLVSIRVPVEIKNCTGLLVKMSDSDTSSGDAECTNPQMKFVRILQEFPVLLSKSQLPKVKEQKAKAVTDMIAKWKKEAGVILTDKQLTKKINNMKTEVKSKADVMKTENKPIVLKEWEKLLLQLLQADTNPTISCVKGKFVLYQNVRLKA